MGCSPSKGKLFPKLAEAPQDVDRGPAEEEDTCLKTKEKEDEVLLLTEKHDSTGTTWIQLDSNIMSAKNPENSKEIEVNPTPQEIICDVSEIDEMKKMDSRKKKKGSKRSTEKQRKSSVVQSKMDFPPHMVRAHQAAYNFLNPNISKYETLLGLLDQAAQTHISLQPMITAVVMRFEEINQALEGIAEDGEQMLMEHGYCMALPSGMLGQAVRSTKPSTNITNHSDPPPDHLQQLLQHSAEKMRQVGGSVQTLGDTTLVEAVEFFSSLSKLLAQKLQAKQAAERRLAQVLTQVEGAAIRKSNPEDSALHSEDSGIGGENESLAGSEKQRHNGSAGSGNCGSQINIQDALDNCSNHLANSVACIEDDEEDEEDEEQDGVEEYEDDENCRPERKRSSSSPPDPSQALLYMQANCLQNQQLIPKRPLTAASSEHSSSTCSLILMTELQKSLKEPDPNNKTVSEIQGTNELKRPNYNLYRAGLRRQYLNGLNRTLVESHRPSLPSLPMLASQPPKLPSVRRLINTFSQEADGRPQQGISNVPPHMKRPNKNHIILLSKAGNSDKKELIFNCKKNTNSWTDSRVDLDVDNLPPPPLEVLMDKSFQSNEGQPQSEEQLQEDPVQYLPVINQKTGIYQRRKITIQNVNILPNRANMKPRSLTIRSTGFVGPDTVTRVQHEELQLETDVDQETEKANNLYQQEGKIIHLCNATKYPDKTSYVQFVQARMGQRFENQTCESEMSSCSLPVTTPPVSRVRLPPSCPSVCHRFPSPPAFKPQSTSGFSSHSSSPQTIIHAAENTTEKITPSVSFQDARSFFSRNELQNSQMCLFFNSPVPPRAQREASRGRLLTRQTNGSTLRTQSEQRSIGISHTESETNLDSRQARASETAQNKGLMTES
ncbi:uncharacterized protein LOC108249976 [Kryptolebias marmoratus]|uniref:uncharacterized protein LOC108249976 n=1 Tax=Kryptolebias marmoratus TaxID=37003 RepID=UPI0007F928EE|nr:uncharacterized protein LOC108249976 [Kryptolebias marmoratus]